MRIQYVCPILLPLLAHAQLENYLLPTLFGNNGDACPAPASADCLTLMSTLSGKNDSTFVLLHNTYTTVGTEGTCTLAAFWAQNQGEGSYVIQYETAAQALQSMLVYADGVDGTSGVLASVQPENVAPVFWAALSDATKFEGCIDSTTLMDETRAPSRRNRRRIEPLDPETEEIDTRDLETRTTINIGGYICTQNLGLWWEYRYTCNCNGNYFKVYCDYDSGNDWWTETDRAAAIAGIPPTNQNPLSPGQKVSSLPEGAFLYATTRAPSSDEEKCCSDLLSQACSPQFAPGSSSSPSDYGSCERYWDPAAFHMYYFARIFGEAAGILL